MKEPTFDANGYPTEDTLDTIKNWKIETNADFEAAMDFAGAAWKYPDYWRKQRRWRDQSNRAVSSRTCLRYTFSTGGWSGNESIVAAISDNLVLQMIGAWSWRRGGHYEYRFGSLASNPRSK